MNWENLCFEGCGLKGYSFVGVAKALEEKDKLKNVKRFIGSSSGSIMATALACRIPAAEIEEFAKSFDIKTTLDFNWNTYLSSAYNFITNWGACSGEYCKFYVAQMLKKYVEDENITFAGLKELKQTELVITGSNINTGKTEFFSSDITPAMKIVDAVRISISVPMIFIPVYMNGYYYIDGGIYNDYPIRYFDKLYETGQGFSKTYGFKMTSSYNDELKKNIYGSIEFLSCCMESMVMALEKNKTRPQDYRRTLTMDSGISSFDLNITAEQKEELINLGYNTTMAMLK